MDLMAARRRLIEMQGLPSAYRRVAYLESSGIQYLDLGKVVSTSDYMFYFKVSPTAFPPNGGSSANYNGIMGRNSSPQVGFYSGGWTVGSAGSSEPYAPQVGQIYEIVYSKNFVGDYYVDDVYTGLSRAGDMLCRLFWIESKSDNSKCRLYKAYAKDSNGEFLYNVLPCVRKSDSEAGMYDTVSHTFYTNAGTGEFIIPS